MGVNIAELVPKKEISFRELSGKIIAVDTSLFLYQFLTSIRQGDGGLLKDVKGRVTSHLAGLFSRTTKLMSYGIKLAYVLDGKPPEMKKRELEKRLKSKQEAEARYKIAAEKGDITGMKKYASRTTRLTKDMVHEARELIAALGLPVIQAPCEAEAQASYIVKKGDAYAIASQDADSLMFGASRLLRNLSLAGRKKKANAISYKPVRPELINLSDVYNSLGLDHDHLIALCMLVGTDYNPGGVKGIGPKSALKLVMRHKSDLGSVFKEAGWDDIFPVSWEEIFYLIKQMPVSDDYTLSWDKPDAEKVIEILVGRHSFSRERVDAALNRVAGKTEKLAQRGLGEFI